MKHFYSHLIEIDSLIVEISNLEIEDHEKKHLINLAESSIYHAVLDSILSELKEEDKKIFLEHLASDNHEKIWKHLNQKIENIEEKIKSAAETLKKELRDDVNPAPFSHKVKGKR